MKPCGGGVTWRFRGRRRTFIDAPHMGGRRVAKTLRQRAKDRHP
jgi:hypothetical protein